MGKERIRRSSEKSKRMKEERTQGGRERERVGSKGKERGTDTEGKRKE